MTDHATFACLQETDEVAFSPIERYRAYRTSTATSKLNDFSEKVCVFLLSPGGNIKVFPSPVDVSNFLRDKGEYGMLYSGDNPDSATYIASNHLKAGIK